jgi:hypothetical protein
MKKYMMFILVIISICVILVCFQNYIQTKLRNIGEKYIDYYDYITIPSSSYDIIADTDNKKYFVEFNDRFFIDTFNKHVSNVSISDETFRDININVVTMEDIQNKTAAYIEGILNEELEMDETNLFFVVEKKLLSVKYDDSSYIVQMKSLIHRNGKAYGITLVSTTLHNPIETQLIKYDILGFVFEDKLYGNVLPSNLMTVENLQYEDIMKDKIIIDKESETKTLCKYLKDMKKFRNIDYTSFTGSNTNCDG